MADPKSKTPKAVKADTETTKAATTPDPAATDPAVTLPVASDPSAPPAAAEPLSPVPADPVSAAVTELLGEVPFSVPLSLVSEVEAGEVQPPIWSFYAQRCEAAVDVLKERCRQVTEEGCAPESDDGYTDYQLPRAAICYAIKAAGLPSHRATLYWPFPAAAFKPTERRANLVKAAALLLAEIERLDRAESPAD